MIELNRCYILQLHKYTTNIILKKPGYGAHEIKIGELVKGSLRLSPKLVKRIHVLTKAFRAQLPPWQKSPLFSFNPTRKPPLTARTFL
jgi:hypothetical protein